MVDQARQPSEIWDFGFKDIDFEFWDFELDVLGIIMSRCAEEGG